MRKKAPTTKASTTITRPPYALESVDNALRLLQMLRHVGALRLKDLAEELGTGRAAAADGGSRLGLSSGRTGQADRDCPC